MTTKQTPNMDDWVRLMNENADLRNGCKKRDARIQELTDAIIKIATTRPLVISRDYD